MHHARQKTAQMETDVSATTQPTVVPSPLATGGSGERFEQRVDAYALALLLVGAIPPVLLDTRLVEVAFQTRRLGWQTDDLLLVGEITPGVHRKLAVQVKRSFTLAKSDEACCKTLRAMWQDSRATDRFDADQDRLAIATLHGTATLLSDFQALLANARAASSFEDFQARLGTTGVVSQKTRSQHEAVRGILCETEGEEAITDEQFWRFLKVLVVLSLDLGTETSHTEAAVLSLLAHTATGTGDARTVGGHTWRALLDEAGTQRQQAGVVRYELLPQAIRDAHSSIPSTESRALRALTEHGRVMRATIRSTIGGIGLLRTEKSNELLLAIVGGDQIVTGVAGAGKSALVERVLTRVEKERPVLAFQAVEFAKPHLNDVLASAAGDIRIEALMAMLAAHDSVVIFIDGVERLLEHHVRDAFRELLALVKNHPSLRIVATCRDYSLETVRSSLFGQVDRVPRVLQLIEVTDDELDELSQALPHLAVPLRDPYLRTFLRTPYLLEMASRLYWTEETLPVDAREFRQKFWREIVRDEAHQAGGMPTRRGQTFIDVARRRASELRPYVSTRAEDADVIAALRADSLLVQPPERDTFAAPAHDVLEDWAILKWFDDAMAGADDVPAVLSAMVDGLPAIRRGLRRWLGERLDVDASSGREVVLSVMARSELPQYFRDDCVAAVLLSSSARSFVASCGARVRGGDLPLLRQIIHMLRVGCKQAPLGMSAGALPSTFLVPVGEGWVATLELVAESIDALLPDDAMLVLGLIEEWARQVAIGHPTPEGAIAVGSILDRLVPLLDKYHDDQALERALEVLLKVPVETRLFRELVERAIRLDRNDSLSREFADHLITKDSAAFASFHLPEEVIRVANGRLRLTNDDAREGHRHSMEVAEFFGVNDRGGDFFPASAWRGPFVTLLRFHPQRGVDFILQLMNHAAEWYVRDRPGDRLEPAEQIVLDVPGTGNITQWFNWRLYALHRGMHVGPYSLQSALMALEEWLLSRARNGGFNLDAWLCYILTQSNSVLTAGIATSLCLAYPERTVNASLALLSSPQLIRTDKARMMQESSVRAEVLTGLNSSHALYEMERRRANALPHRKGELESLALQLQSTGHRDLVWRLLDRHRANLPSVGAASGDADPGGEALPTAGIEATEADATAGAAAVDQMPCVLRDADEGEQGDDTADDIKDDRIWRLALHRMDVRGYRVVEPPADAATTTDDGSRLVYVAPGELEPDVQEMVEDAQRRFADFNRHGALLNEARSAWDKHVSVEAWRELLRRARESSEEGEPDQLYLRGGPGIVAAIGIRDHLQELSEADLSWCALRVQYELSTPKSEDDYIMRRHSVMFGPDRAAAAVCSRLLSRAPYAIEGDPLNFIAGVLTHPIDEVVNYAFEGAASLTEERDSEVLLQFVSALIAEADEAEAIEAERQSVGAFGITEVANAPQRRRDAVRASLNMTSEEVLEILRRWPILGWTRERAAIRVCSLLRGKGEWRDVTDFFLRAADWLGTTWRNGRRKRGHSGNRDYHGEADLTRLIAQFALKREGEEALRICKPLIALVESEPSETEHFLRALIVQADGNAHDCFWTLWQAYADAIAGAPWAERLHRDGPYEEVLVNRIFLNLQWKSGVTHWERLTGESHRLDALIQRLPAGVACLGSYMRLLYTVGRQSLPEAFLVVSAVLERGNAVKMASDGDISFALEALLAPFVYGQPLRLKSNPTMRLAVLEILDALVNAGSSAAYRMRDDFVTPVRADAP